MSTGGTLRVGLALVLFALLMPSVAGCKRTKEAKVEAVWVGKGATCVRLVGGSVRCAGPGGGVHGEVGAGFREIPILKDATSIALAETSGCAVAPPRMLCFGTAFRATIEAPAFFDASYLAAASVVATDDAVCVHESGLRLRCFDATGHAGPELMSTKLTPAAGAGSSCGIADDGKARCFGDLAAITLAASTPLTSLAVRAGRVCGVAADASVWCATKAGPEPARPVDADVVAFQGDSLCVAHRNKTLSCEEHGVLRPLSGVFAVKSLSGAAGNACFVGQEGVAFCWGENARAELGTPEKGLREVPAAIFFRQSGP